MHGTLSAKRTENIHPPKSVVFTLISAETGEARSRVIPNVKAHTLYDAIALQVDTPNSRLMTDELMSYREIGRQFGRGHDRVTHNLGEYVRGDVSTNKAENYFGQLQRSLAGTFHHVSDVHLPRYLAEFDFRYSTRKMTDTARLHRLMGTTNRRLSYRPLTGQ
jgi:hypothetical protein